MARHLSSYIYPMIWSHVELLGLSRSSRALKKLRGASGFVPPCGTTFSNRLLETKFVPEAPVLRDYNAAHDAVALINHHFSRRGLPILAPANELVRFNCAIPGLGGYVDLASAQHRDPVGELAVRSGFSQEVILNAVHGRLLPKTVCNAIIAASADVRNLAVVERALGRNGGTPCNEGRALQSVLVFFARGPVAPLAS